MSTTFNTRFSFDEKHSENAKIKVVGVGGGGGNALNNMIAKGLTNVDYIAINTDAQALRNNGASITIQAGQNLTAGLGAGARPEIGREAVEESRHELEEAIEGADMIFVTAGMGGGTGTGGAPIVASIAKRKGILTVGVVTTPFDCEGRVRMKYATEGIVELKKTCDTVIVIPNERLLDISDENTSLMEAFEMANEVLYNATRGISDLVLMPGLINLDFADVKTTMMDGGAAIMGSDSAAGPDRAEIAARGAIASPLLDGVSIRGARNVLVNVSASMSMGMREFSLATSIIQQEAGEDAEIIMGSVLDESMGDELRVTVIATGFEMSGEKGHAVVTQQPNRGMHVNNRSHADGFSQQASTPKAPPVPQFGARFGGLNKTEHYKGENNLKKLDEPAINRRELTVRKLREEDNRPTGTEERGFNLARQTGTDRNVLLNNREERIDKSDTEQPAFLRRIMD